MLATGRMINHRQARVMAYLDGKGYHLDEKATNERRDNAVVVSNGRIRVAITPNGPSK